MPQIGGSITSISFNGRQFSVPADSDYSMKIGGFENEVLANGDQSARLIKTRVPLSITGITLAIDDSLQDLEFLQDLANAKVLFDMVVELASGAFWTGRAQITGELVLSTQAATSGFDIMGEGKLVQQ